MPKINTIAIVPVPKLSDKLVGTSVGGTPVNQTNNFTLQQLKTLFDGAPVSPNLQAVLNAGNTATQNIYLTGTIDTVNLDVSNDSFLKNLYLSERLFDRNNFQGTNGQYLTSTGTGVQWSTLTIATPTLQQVLTAGNISDKNIITTGNIQAANIEGTNITANTNLRVVGTLSDSSNSVGGSGQVLSSTVTGTDWIDFPSYSAVSPLIYNNVLKQFSIQVATSTQNGYLSSADWITFNGKQNAGNYITALTGEASALGPGSVNITLNNLAVINKTLTGLAISSGVITAADSIITAFGKIQGQINGIVAGVVYQGVWNAATNTPTLTSSVGVQGHYYVVDVAGNTNLNGITDWQVGDWAIYNGTAWQKVDNTDSVTSVNGQTGIVVLNSDNIAEGTTNLYYLDSRARAAISSVATGLTYTSATGVFSLTAGYSIPTVANQTNWTTAYNDSIVSAAVTGTTTKTLTLTQQDGGTITASWTDIDTNLVTSVFGRTGAVVAQAGDYSTTLVTEGTNLYYLDSRARSAISSSATGLTYTTATGVFSFTAGYSIPTDASQSNWTTAYNDSITSAAVTGTTTKTLTLNQQDGGTITASWTDLDTGLTSVGVSMPSAFNVTNSPLTSNGTIAVTGAGTAAQYVRGDGTLGDFPTGGGGGGASVSYYLNGSINQGTFGGNTYYQMSKTPILGAGTDFSTSTNGYIAQFITDVGTPDALLIPGGNWNFETYFSASSGGGSPTFYIELYKYDGATFTLIASNSSNPELIAFGTTINPYYNSLAVPETILLATDRLAIRIYVFTSGRTITLHTEDNHLCQAITTFTTGLTALNGLTKQIQYFAVGTSGTDFNISSSVATHTFNLPTASATNRGALSSSDWSTFNSKQNALTLTTSGSSGPATLIGATLNIPDYGSALSGYVPYTGASQAVNLGIYSLSAGSLFVNGPAPTSGSYLGFKQATSVTTGGGGYTSISTFGTSQMNFSFAQPSGFKEFKFDVSSITTGVPGGRVYTMPDADGTIALVGGSGVGTVTSVAALTLGTSGTDLSSTVANSTTTPVITLNVPTASATNRGALSSADWTTFNNKQNALTLTTTGSSGASTLVGATLNIPQYQSVLTNPITGTGTTNYLAKFTGSTTIGNSQVFDNGTNVGIGTSSPATRLMVQDSGNTFVGHFSGLNQTNGVAIGTNSLNVAVIQGYTRTFSATNNIALQADGGNLLVGTTSDNGAKLQVSGAVSTSSKYAWGTASNGTTGQIATDNTHNYFDYIGNLYFRGAAASNTLITFTSAGAATFSSTIRSNDTYGFAIGSIASYRRIQYGSDNATSFTLLTDGNAYAGLYAGAATFSSNVAAGSTSSGAQINVFASSYGNNGLFNAYGTDNLIKLQMGALGTNEGFIFTGSGNKISFFSGGNLALTLNSNQAATFSSSVTANGLNALGSTLNNGNAIRFYRAGLTEMAYIGWTNENTNNSTWYFKSSNGNPIGFSADGTNQQVTIATSGNVGIGTTSPASKLDLYNGTDLGLGANGIRVQRPGVYGQYGYLEYLPSSDITVLGSLYSGGGASVYGQIYFRQHSSTTYRDVMVINASGNVGINTASPTTYSLSGSHVENFGGSTFAFIHNNTTTVKSFYATNESAGLSVLYTFSNHPLLFGTNNTERMRITSSGNVLIGTTTDNGARLQVSGAATFSSTVTSNGAGFIIQGDQQYRMNGYNSGYSYITTNAGFNGNYNGVGIFSNATNANSLPAWLLDLGGLDGPTRGITDAFVIARKASGGSWNNYLAINASGNVGIGTSSPGQNLHVSSTGVSRLLIENTANQSTGAGLQMLVISGASTVGNGTIRTDNADNMQFFNIGGERMRITSGGNVLIGTTTDVGDRVNVNGSIRVPQTFFFRYDGDTGIFGSATSITGGSASQLGIRAASDILFATNGANERMRITSGGNVVITADAGNEQLTIRRASNTNAQLINGVHSSGYAWIQSIEQNVGYRPLVLNRDGGNVLIGTTSAYTSRLTVQGAAGNRPAIKAGFGASAGNGYWVLGDNYTLDESLTSYGIDYSSGDLVLGSIVAPSTTTSGAFISTQAQFGNLGSAIRAGNSGDIYFFRGTSTSVVSIGGAKSMTESMRLNSSGNLLIGTTTDVGARLYVDGAFRTGTLTAGTQTTAVDWRLGNARGGAATNNALIRVQINGVLVDLLGNYV